MAAYKHYLYTEPTKSFCIWYTYSDQQCMINTDIRMLGMLWPSHCAMLKKKKNVRLLWTMYTESCMQEYPNLSYVFGEHLVFNRFPISFNKYLQDLWCYINHFKIFKVTKIINRKTSKYHLKLSKYSIKQNIFTNNLVYL